jgi:hypothetical protein
MERITVVRHQTVGTIEPGDGERTMLEAAMLLMAEEIQTPLDNPRRGSTPKGSRSAEPVNPTVEDTLEFHYRGHVVTLDVRPYGIPAYIGEARDA